MHIDEKTVLDVEKLIMELNILSFKYPILVEGKKDKIALRTLGVKGKIIYLSGKRLFDVTDNLLKFRKVIILTDLDKAGTKIANNLCKQLIGRGVTPLMNFREHIYRITKGRVREIEGLKKFVFHLIQKSCPMKLMSPIIFENFKLTVV